MDRTRLRRGYALTGFLSLTALGCPADDDDGSDTETGTTGFPLTGTESGTAGNDTGTSETETGDPPGKMEGDPCSYRGDICAEYIICKCSCDYSAACCECGYTTCTQDDHCPEGYYCRIYLAGGAPNSTACLPEMGGLAGASEVVDPSAFADPRSDIGLPDLELMTSLPIAQTEHLELASY